MNPTTTSSVQACKHSVDSIQAERYGLTGVESTNSLLMKPTTAFQTRMVVYLITLACFVAMPTNFFSGLLLLLSVLMGVLSVMCLRKSLLSTVSAKPSPINGSSQSKASELPRTRTSLVWNSRTGTSYCLNCLRQWTPPQEIDISSQSGKNSQGQERPSALPSTSTTRLTWLKNLSHKEYRQRLCGEMTPTEKKS